MSSQPQKGLMYRAKHAYNGKVESSQLSFAAGAIIVARPGQEGNSWWWGSYNGRDGWFPPAYVTPISNPTPPSQSQTTPSMQQQQQQQQQQQLSMKDRMTNTTFTSSTARQQKQQRSVMNQQQNRTSATAAAATDPFVSMTLSPNIATQKMNQTQNNMNTVQQQQQQQQQQQLQRRNTFNSTPVSSFGADDPFAGLDLAPSASSTLPAPVTPQQNTTATTNVKMTPVQSDPLQQVFMSTSSTPTPTTTTNTTAAAAAAAVPTMAKAIPSPSNQTNANMMGSMSQSNSLQNVFQQPSLNNNTKSQPQPQQQSKPQPQPQLQQPQKTQQESVQSAQQRIIEEQRKKAQLLQLEKKALMEQREREQQEQLQKKRLQLQQQQQQQQQQRQQQQPSPQMQQQQQQQQSSKHSSQPGTPMQSTTSSIHSTASSPSQPSSKPFPVTNAATPMAVPQYQSGGKYNLYQHLAGLDAMEPVRKFDPIYKIKPFWALMNLDMYVRKSLPPVAKNEKVNVAEMYANLSKALEFICHIVQRSQKTLEFLKDNHLACEACIRLISLLPHSAGTSGRKLDQLFLDFINIFVSLVEKMKADQQLVIPGGWQTTDKAQLCLYILRHCGDTFSFTICNTGSDGLQFHPSKFNEMSGKEEKNLALTLWNIPPERVLDSSFWVPLFRLQVYPSKRNTAAYLYTKLLPALNSAPLLANIDFGPAEFHPVPSPIAALSYNDLAALALTSTPSKSARSSKYAHLFLMNASLNLAYESIATAGPSSMDPEDSRILKLAGRNLANFASSIEASEVQDGTLPATLSSTWELLDRVLKKLIYSSSKPVDQHSDFIGSKDDSFSKGVLATLQTEPRSISHPFFGRLRRDDYDSVCKGLMGDPRVDPILIPPVITDPDLPHIVTSYQEASSSLQRLSTACSLLLQQRSMIKNASAFAASAAQHCFIVTLPMPQNDPKQCFWRKYPMRRETQISLLFLIRKMCRIYSAATACVQQSRGLIAIRSTAFACAACISDAISRVKAVDDPSPFSLHYSGLCEGPTEPFGVEAGSFATLAKNLPMYDAKLCSLRSTCLNYLRAIALKNDGTERLTIFNFDQSSSPMSGDMLLIDELSIQLALPRPYPATEQAKTSQSATLISGVNGSILEVLPEFEYFRDIIFYFKHSVSGSSNTPPGKPEEVRPWLPSDATLKWSTEPRSAEDSTPVYVVKAYAGHRQEFILVGDDKASSKSKFQSFLAFFGRGGQDRTKLSSADPTNIVNSCSEKYSKPK